MASTLLDTIVLNEVPCLLTFSPSLPPSRTRNSGDKIHFFFEPDAFDSTTGKLNKPKSRSINKIGHGLHALDPAFRQFTLENQRLKTLAKELDYHRDPKVLQSMVICKQPEIGGCAADWRDVGLAGIAVPHGRPTIAPVSFVILTLLIR